ncbi:hypothetical protein H8356DRAFT_1340790 [Neocallimastix lanati (nom. inval.)]|nr:hypothetical protein H8356DRAFT_1340790 [Neocallimastix sp. JGI-2020a]
MNYGILLHSQGRIFFLCDVLRGKTILTFVIPELMIKFQASIILRVFWHNLSIPFLLIVCNSFLERAYLIFFNLCATWNINVGAVFTLIQFFKPIGFFGNEYSSSFSFSSFLYNYILVFLLAKEKKTTNKNMLMYYSSTVLSEKSVLRRKAYDSVPIFNILTKLFHLGIYKFDIHNGGRQETSVTKPSKRYHQEPARTNNNKTIQDEFSNNFIFERICLLRKEKEIFLQKKYLEYNKGIKNDLYYYYNLLYNSESNDYNDKFINAAETENINGNNELKVPENINENNELKVAESINRNKELGASENIKSFLVIILNRHSWVLSATLFTEKDRYSDGNVKAKNTVGQASRVNASEGNSF